MCIAFFNKRCNFRYIKKYLKVCVYRLVSIDMYSRPKIQVLPWCFGVSQDPKHIIMNFPNYDFYPMGNILHSASSLIGQTNCTLSVPHLPGFIFLPACGIKPTPSSDGKREQPILLLLQSLSPSLCLFTLPLNTTPVCLNGVCCPFPPNCGYVWWINCCPSPLSSVGCHVFNISYLRWKEDLFLSLVGWLGGNQSTYCIYSYPINCKDLEAMTPW